MYNKHFLLALSGIAVAAAQGFLAISYPTGSQTSQSYDTVATTPPVSTLSTTMSGVLPEIPSATPFLGVETIEGAIVDDGPIEEGFTGMYPQSLLDAEV